MSPCIETCPDFTAVLQNDDAKRHVALSNTTTSDPVALLAIALAEPHFYQLCEVHYFPATRLRGVVFREGAWDVRKNHSKKRVERGSTPFLKLQ